MCSTRPEKSCRPGGISRTSSPIYRPHLIVSVFASSFLDSLQPAFCPSQATNTTTPRHRSSPDVPGCFPRGSHRTSPPPLLRCPGLTWPPCHSSLSSPRSSTSICGFSHRFHRRRASKPPSLAWHRLNLRPKWNIAYRAFSTQYPVFHLTTSKLELTNFSIKTCASKWSPFWQTSPPFAQLLGQHVQRFSFRPSGSKGHRGGVRARPRGN